MRTCLRQPGQRFARESGHHRDEFYALITPGDRVDLTLQSLGADGTRNAQCDRTFMSLTVNTTIAPEPKQPNGKLFLTGLPTPQLQVLSPPARLIIAQTWCGPGW